MVKGEVRRIMQSLEYPGVRQGLFRLETEGPDFRREFQDRVKSLDVVESTALFRAILGRTVRVDESRTAHNNNTNERNAAVGILPMLNLTLIDPEVITATYVSSVDTLTERIDCLPNPTERAREIFDVGETLSPYFLRTPKHLASIAAVCTALADKIPYEHYYGNPYKIIDLITGDQTEPSVVVDFSNKTKPRKKNDREIAAEGMKLKIIETLAIDPDRQWSVKELADELGINKNTLASYCHILGIYLSRTWTK